VWAAIFLAYVQTLENKALNEKARHDGKKRGKIIVPVAFFMYLKRSQIRK
jgi:hypothetical protein